MPYGTVNADVIQTSTSGGILGAGNASIMKNRIINGAMVIDQRNAGASINNTNTGTQFSVDRWAVYGDQVSKFSLQQNAGSVTPPVGFTNYIGMTSLSAYTVGTNEQFKVYQNIEGFNIADLGWGTANAKTVTLSFWAYSSLTGTFGGSLINNNNNRSYPFAYTISSANTWTQISVTIAGDTTGTWGTTNGTGVAVQFSMGTGSGKSGTAGAWAASNLVSVTGAVSVLGTNGATLYLTGVQFEVGSSATGFEYLNYQTSLANCQRYYETSGYGMMGIGNSSTGIVCGYSFKVPKRAAPTMGLYTTSQVWPEIGISNRTSSSVSIGDAALVNTDSIVPRIEGFSGINTNASLVCYTPIAFTFNAEL
jgi:hypothetical protein